MTDVCKSCPHKSRSVPDHRRLYALIKAAYEHWPDTAAFKPANSEHLRSWLICAAGPDFRRVNTFDVSGVDDATRALIVDVMRDDNTHGGLRGDILYKVQPVSMKFERMNQRDFAAMREGIEEVIENTLGVTCDELLREKETAA